MKKYKLLALLNLILILFSSCGTIQEGFSNSKKKSVDEFLVEKKLPLTMPPEYNNLPIPKINNNLDEINNNKIKKLITESNGNKSILNKNNDLNKSFEEKVINKIKNN